MNMNSGLRVCVGGGLIKHFLNTCGTLDTMIRVKPWGEIYPNENCMEETDINDNTIVHK